jgi:hypothetical protein
MALFKAIDDNDAEVVHFLLNSKDSNVKDLLEQTDSSPSKQVPLTHALQANANIRIISDIIKAYRKLNIDINKKDLDGNSE